MISASIHSHGGRTHGKTQRNNAIAAYYLSPNLCKNCGIVIDVAPHRKVRDARKKVFCTRSCAAAYNYALGALNGRRRIRKIKHCAGGCGAEVYKNKRWCRACRRIELDRFLTRSKSEVTGPEIRAWARLSLIRSGRPLVCEECGYDKHVDCCHIRAVGEFSGEVLIAIINDIANLKWLCRNHHWEHDHL